MNFLVLLRDIEFFCFIETFIFKMPYMCTNCTYVANLIKELCRHLRISHCFYEGSQLNLKCCFPNCPSILKTYSGFRNHIVKCKVNTEKVCNVDVDDDSNNLTEILPNYISNTDKDINTRSNNESNTNTHKDLIRNKNESINKSIKNFVHSNLTDISEDISNSLLTFIRNLYSFGIPDTSIDKILQCIYQLVNLVFEKILDNVDKSNVICWQIVSTFFNSFEMYLTKYKRHKNYKNYMVKPLEKSCGVRMEQKFDSQLRIYKTVPSTCTFTYVPIIETLKFLFQNNSFKKIIFDSFNAKKP